MGTTYYIQPIAPMEDNTVRVAAGVVTFGLEMRDLNPAIVEGFYEGRPDHELVTEITDGIPDPIDDGGPSIHVFGTADGLEYLRFDCFRNGPHYHYVHPRDEFQVVHEMDPVAFGDPWTWTLGRLRERLPQMLAEAGGADLAAAVDPTAVAAALEKVTELRRSVAEVPA
jgi:hypothetical protein